MISPFVIHPNMDDEEVTVVVTDEFHISQARHAAKQMADRLGFTTKDAALLVTSVSEMATNLYFHTNRGGELSVRRVTDNGRIGIEVMAEDDGPGIEDLELAMSDGYTTKCGLGAGLPGVKRLMDSFHITSRVGEGTRVVAVKWGSTR